MKCELKFGMKQMKCNQGELKNGMRDERCHERQNIIRWNEGWNGMRWNEKRNEINEMKDDMRNEKRAEIWDVWCVMKWYVR